MRFRFFKRVSILPGIGLNFGGTAGGAATRRMHAKINP
jgi:hypothetical protein